MCDRVLVLESGHLNFDGDVDEGIRYLQYDDAERHRGEQWRPTTSSAPTSERQPAAGLNYIVGSHRNTTM